MPSDFAPVCSILAAEREQGRPFAKAWKLALETIEDREARQVLNATRKAWRDGYETARVQDADARLMHGLTDTRRMTPEESTTPDLLELGRRSFDAGRRADIDGLMGFYRSNVVIEMPSAGLTFEGLTEIRRFWEDFFGLWEDLGSELEELLDLGNGITFSAIGHRGRPVGSTAETQQRVSWVATWEGDKITRVDIYVDIDEARSAAERLAEERG